MTAETAYLAGGCFWCLEAIYKELEGVTSVRPGFMGGTTEKPSYEQVCTGTTGHAEVVEVIFDPAVISFDDLLDVFFSIHDPTQLNRQGNDIGTQYRSAIFYRDATQKAAAEAAIARAAALWHDPIVTEIAPAGTFWPAEAYHHDYFARNPEQPYCAAVVAPKVAKARAKWAKRLKRGAA
ncbi:MAG: peptide-methionine (S)-S-oxide reductase [Alphaproteobacteria bacterium]|nr:MAG: peptide-methionine (S)-S-oxide reductase [Alphaproteobacteria bacterium]